MRRHKLFTAVPALAFAIVAGACDDGLADINRNPNNPEEVPVETVLSSGIWDVVANAGGRGVFGEWTTLYHTSLWPQHIAQSAYNDEDRYSPREGVNENIWEEMYAGALQDLQRTKELAQESGDQNLHAVAEIMQVYGFLFLTDMFGDVPYFEALNLEEFPKPAFTPQAEIYTDLLTRLEAAANEIDPAANATFATGDLIYDGNLQQWKEFANSLRLRVAIRLADTELAETGRAAFAAAWAADKFDDNSDIADLDWAGTPPAQNPIYEQIVIGGRTGDFRVSSTLVDTLKSLNDPRLPIFADPAKTDGAYRGLPNGRAPAQAGGTVDHFSWIGSYFIQPTTPSVLMSYSEMLLLGAEAAARGWIADDPATLYRQGIEASMQQYGVAQTDIDAYLAQPKVAYNGLPSIGVQKWIALYLAGPEAFTEVRRTGYPQLQLAFNNVTGAFPARLPYPPDEGLYNAENFAPYENVSLTDPVWFMQ